MIFEEYARLDRGAAAGAGAGLGLAIADRICRALGHALKVRSRVGQGSVFSITLTRTASEPGAAARARAPALAGGLKVLCVDDDPAVLESMAALMRRWGMEVTAAASAAQAYALDGAWDVVLADYHLGGGVSGLDLLRELGGRAARARW
ncbi:MAG: response regulator [Caulobacteraceae bacterium]